MTKHTPAPLKISYWKDARYADGYSTVITDCRGHGLFESLQKGKNAKVEANACLLVESPAMLSLLTDLLKARTMSDDEWRDIAGNVRALLYRVKKQEALPF